MTEQRFGGPIDPPNTGGVDCTQYFPTHTTQFARGGLIEDTDSNPNMLRLRISALQLVAKTRNDHIIELEANRDNLNQIWRHDQERIKDSQARVRQLGDENQSLDTELMRKNDKIVELEAKIKDLEQWNQDGQDQHIKDLEADRDKWQRKARRWKRRAKAWETKTWTDLAIEATSDGTTDIFQALRDIECDHCEAAIVTGERYGFLDRRTACERCMTDCECGYAAYMHPHYTTGVVVDTCAGDNNDCLCARLRASQ